MDMMASESPEYTEEGPEELLDPGEDTGDSEEQTDKPFKLVANNTTKAKASISTQALSVVKAIYADTVETNWEELFDGFDRLYAITFSYPPDGPWYELKYIADELPNSLEAEISGGNQLIMNYEQAQELFGIKFRRWLGIFNL